MEMNKQSIEKYYSGYNRDKSILNIATVVYYIIFLLVNFITSLGCFNFMFDSFIELFVSLYMLILYAVIGINFIKSLIRIIDIDLKFYDLYNNINNLKAQSRYCIFNMILAIYCEDEILLILFLINIVTVIISREIIENKFIHILSRTIKELVKNNSTVNEMETE